MSSYPSTYIGVYLELPYFQDEKIVITYVHPETGAEMKNKFCPSTGVQGVIQENKHIEDVKPCPYIEDDKNLDTDMFWTPAYTGGDTKISTFLLNAWDDDFKDVEDDLFTMDLTEVNPKKLIAEFKTKYAKYLSYYEKKYKSVNIKYGIVNYAH